MSGRAWCFVVLCRAGVALSQSTPFEDVLALLVLLGLLKGLVLHNRRSSHAIVREGDGVASRPVLVLATPVGRHDALQVEPQTLRLRTYFQPQRLLQRMQKMSETVWRPVVISLSSFGPLCTFTTVLNRYALPCREWKLWRGGRCSEARGVTCKNSVYWSSQKRLASIFLPAAEASRQAV